MKSLILSIVFALFAVTAFADNTATCAKQATTCTTTCKKEACKKDACKKDACKKEQCKKQSCKK